MKNPFKRKVVLPTIGVEVHILADTRTESLGDVLGITRERYDVLAEVIKAGVEKGEAPMDTIAAVSKVCCHPNELAMCSFVVGSMYERQMNPMAGILNILLK